MRDNFDGPLFERGEEETSLTKLACAEISRLRESNERLLEALKDAQCDLDAMKLLGQRLGSYETTRIKVRAAIAAAEGEK